MLADYWFRIKKRFYGVVIALLCVGSTEALELSGHIGLESLGFFYEGLSQQQHQHYLSGSFQPELYHEWDEGRQSLAFVPFYRLSQHDSRRTHFDIRELTWLKAADDWELRVGIRKVFWGVSESQHLVDIINQTDLVENFDTEDKLGQPMINLALIQDWGTLDFFLLPGFRERTFSGEEGRFRFDPAVDTGEERYEKSGLEKHMAYAIRWSHSIADWDVGVAHFFGTNREPSFIIEPISMETVRLIPYYETIHQTGVDLQYTQDNVLWKLEAIVRSGMGKTYFASTAGFEYTFYSVFDSAIDLGVVAEYLYDTRGSHATNIFQDDFLVAVRLGFNDIQSTELLAGIIFDRENNTKFYNLEASRRIGDNWKAELELRFFSSVPPQDLAYWFRDDDHIRFELRYYF